MWPSSCSATTVVSTTASTSPPAFSPNSGHRMKADSTAKPTCVSRMLEQPARAVAARLGPDLQLAEFAPQREVAEDEKGQRRGSGRCASASPARRRPRRARSTSSRGNSPRRTRSSETVIDDAHRETARLDDIVEPRRCARSACRRGPPSDSFRRASRGIPARPARADRSRRTSRHSSPSGHSALQSRSRLAGMSR